MKKLVLLCALAGLPLAALAAQEGSGAATPGGAGMGMPGHGMGMNHGAHLPPGPRAEFRTACEGKRAGDKVSVNTPRGPMQGTCQLMFRPDAPPQGERERPQGGATGPAGKSGPPPAPR